MIIIERRLEFFCEISIHTQDNLLIIFNSFNRKLKTENGIKNAQRNHGAHPHPGRPPLRRVRARAEKALNAVPGVDQALVKSKWNLERRKLMTKKIVPLILACLLAFSLTAAAQVRQPPTTSGGSGSALLNLDNTVALHGYDPTAYFFAKKALKGNKRIHERVGSATYYFRSRANRYEFLSNAPQYQPQFGGYCATSLSRGRLEDIDPHIFAVYNNKLYLFKDPEARAIFWSNPERIIAEASAHYFELAKQKRERW
jgi:hypothetical protein